MSRTGKKSRAGLAWLKKFGVFQPGDISEKFVKAQIPASWFTKKGPGVEADAQKAFHRLTYEQKVVAVEKGWIPKLWIIPYLGHCKQKENLSSSR